MTTDPLIEMQRVTREYAFEAGQRKGRSECTARHGGMLKAAYSGGVLSCRATHERPGFWVRVVVAALLLAGVAWWGRRR